MNNSLFSLRNFKKLSLQTKKAFFNTIFNEEYIIIISLSDNLEFINKLKEKEIKIKICSLKNNILKKILQEKKEIKAINMLTGNIKMIYVRIPQTKNDFSFMYNIIKDILKNESSILSIIFKKKILSINHLKKIYKLKKTDSFKYLIFFKIKDYLLKNIIQKSKFKK